MHTYKENFKEKLMKIVMIPDVPNWAFDRNVSAIIKYNPELNITKIFQSQFRKSMFNNFNIVYHCSWLWPVYPPRQAAEITSHNYELLHMEKAKKLIPRFKGIVTKSMILYQKISKMNKFTFYAAGGVHEDLFVPVKKERRKKFVVGWVGQPTKGSYGKSRPVDIKGYHHILLPLKENMKDCKDIEFKIIATSHHTNPRPYNQMPLFYRDVDVQICTSMFEGAPNPMFEAASTGLPLISTKVGAISELIEHNVNGYFIPTYNCQKDIPDRIAQFRKYILYLKNNRELGEAMGKINREKVEKEWAWRIRAKQWKVFFEKFISGKGN